MMHKLQILGSKSAMSVVHSNAGSTLSAADSEIKQVVSQVYRDTQAPTGCPINSLKSKLRSAGLRPTRQRVMLGWMLFAKGHRHVSAEALFEEATRARASLSLATVYNTLRQFTDAGLIRQVHVGAGKAYFDTNIEEHHHFIVEGEDEIFDVEGEAIHLGTIPSAPEGFAVAGVDVIVRLKRLGADSPNLAADYSGLSSR
jgi:Fur family transcriptional regulator, iron response regulator